MACALIANKRKAGDRGPCWSIATAANYRPPLLLRAGGATALDFSC